MVKVRMNTADVAAEVKCLRNLIGMRCSNVYDISPKTYIFKLVSSSGFSESSEGNKSFLLMESGIRLHTTAYMREKNNMPSGFTLKLRKHIRTRRLEDVRQLGYDRIILFQFGLSANAHYIILELYSQGNMLLTDSNFMVLTLLRSHRDDDKGFAIMSRHQYPVESYRSFEHMTFEKLRQALSHCHSSNRNGADGDHVEEKNGIQSEQKNLISSGKQPTLKMVLGEVLGLGPALSEHVILDAGLVPSMKIMKENEFDDGTIHILIKSITSFENWLVDVVSGGKIPEGYILMQKSQFGKNGSSADQFGNMIQLYDEFCPLLLNQFKSRDSVMFEKFDAALDEFYSKIEAQRAEHNQKTKENSSMQKLNRIRVDQGNRVDLLRKEAEHSSKMAQLIEYNIEDVDAAIVAVRVALANGMSWQDVAHMVKEEKKAGNPVANIIGKLNLDRNCITLLLSNNLDEMDDNEKTLPVDEVDIDLSLSANANARKWYELKKKQEGKEEKTVTAHEKAFKAAEKKTRLLLSQEKSVAKILHMRKVHWFEKFNWFISSENYLVISGRDAQQNDIIVKRHMSRGDLYVHAELHGASSTIIKNHKPDLAVPPLTLNQAGCFTVCHSQAWDSKIVTSAWWVYPHQVSKTAPTGEYLTVGSFMIRGKKMFLPPHPLIMGFGLLFRFDESSLGSHLNERRVRGEDDVITGFEETSAMHEMSDSDTEMASFKDPEEVATLEISSQEREVVSDTPTENVNDDDIRISEKGVRLSKSDGDVLSTVFVDTVPPVFNNIELDGLIDRALEIGLVACQKKEDALQTQEEKHDFMETKGDMKGKPHVSKADRRKMKAGKICNAKVTDCHANNDVIGIVSQVDVNESVGKPNNVKVSRGKRSKLKKIKQKYGDQDEEERKIQMSLLASAGKPEKVNKGAENIKNEPSADPQSLAGVDDAQKVCYKCKKQGHLSQNCQEQVKGKATRGDTSGDILFRKIPDFGVEDVGEEKYIVESDTEKIEKVNDLDYFTGIPQPSDILLYAVPVCGPYAALQNYKYKVKIVPGTSKKGKGVKTAMNLFVRMKEMAVREKEVMKACSEPELIAAMLGNVKITAPALSIMQQSQNRHKKTAKIPM